MENCNLFQRNKRHKDFIHKTQTKLTLNLVKLFITKQNMQVKGRGAGLAVAEWD